MRTLPQIQDLKSYPKKFLAPVQLAVHMGISRRTIYHHIEKGALPIHHVGGLIRIRKHDALVYAGEAS